MSSSALDKVIGILLIGIAIFLLLGHNSHGFDTGLNGPSKVLAGVIAGFAIGVVTSLLGVAGGELLIPTLIILFGIDIKLAGSLSLTVSLPTMIVGFARYSRDRSFFVLKENKRFCLTLAAGSILGVFIGAQLLEIAPNGVLIPLLAGILILSALKLLFRRPK